METTEATTAASKISQLLRVLPDAHWYVTELVAAGISTMEVYPALGLLERKKLVTSGWDEGTSGGPRRRYYKWAS